VTLTGVRAAVVAGKRRNGRGAKGCRKVNGVKDGREEGKPAGVPERAKQAGEVRARWAWTEPLVWTERMLTALERGVKGGVWFSLIDKVYAARTLSAAWQAVFERKGAGGVDRQTVEQFAAQAEKHLAVLEEELRTDAYVTASDPAVDAKMRYERSIGSCTRGSLGSWTPTSRATSIRSPTRN
jgi:hypothetical protein